MAEKILIVDDDPETIRLIDLILQRQGYLVLQAPGGAQGISQARSDKPDLILLDVMMPDVDGYQVTQTLRKNPSTAKIPVIMFTAKGQVEDKVAGYEAGVDDYLTKPIHPAELIAHIRGILARRKPLTAEFAKRGRTFGVIGAKGGLGTSTLTLNLALKIQTKTQKEVIAAELRPGQGSWGLELNLSQGLDGFTDLLRTTTTDITESLVESKLVRTTAGVRLLMASNRSGDCEYLKVGAQQMEAILHTLPRLAAFTFFDIGTSFLPDFKGISNACQELILITEPNPTTIQRTKSLMEEMAAYGFGKSKLMTIVVFNRVRADSQYTMAQIKEMLAFPVEHMIPPAPEQAYQAGLRAVPLTAIQSVGLVSEQFGRLADALLPHPPS